VVTSTLGTEQTQQEPHQENVGPVSESMKTESISPSEKSTDADEKKKGKKRKSESGTNTPTQTQKKRKRGSKKKRRKGKKAQKPTQDLEEGEFEVESILDKRITTRGTEYFVKWVGFSDNENSWEPAENVFCLALIAKYEEETRQKRASRHLERIEEGEIKKSELEESEQQQPEQQQPEQQQPEQQQPEQQTEQQQPEQQPEQQTEQQQTEQQNDCGTTRMEIDQETETPLTSTHSSHDEQEKLENAQLLRQQSTTMTDTETEFSGSEEQCRPTNNDQSFTPDVVQQTSI